MSYLEENMNGNFLFDRKLDANMCSDYGDFQRLVNDIWEKFKCYPESLYSMREIQKTLPRYKTDIIHHALISLEKNSQIIRSKLNLNEKIITHWQLNPAKIPNQPITMLNQPPPPPITQTKPITNNKYNYLNKKNIHRHYIPPKGLGQPITRNTQELCDLDKSVIELSNPRAANTIMSQSYNEQYSNFEMRNKPLNNDNNHNEKSYKLDYELFQHKYFSDQNEFCTNNNVIYQNRPFTIAKTVQFDRNTYGKPSTVSNKIFYNDKWIRKDDATECVSRTMQDEKQLFDPKSKSKSDSNLKAINSTELKFETNKSEDGKSISSAKSIELDENNVLLTPSDALNNDLMIAMSKNPVSLLHEFAQQNNMTCQIKILEISGPSHKPNIMIGVELNGNEFEPIVATNKKDGKRSAAEMVIRRLIADGKFSTERKSSANNQQRKSGSLSAEQKKRQKSLKKTRKQCQRGDNTQNNNLTCPTSSDEIKQPSDTTSNSTPNKSTTSSTNESRRNPFVSNYLSGRSSVAGNAAAASSAASTAITASTANTGDSIEQSIVKMTLCVQNKVTEIISDLAKEAGINLAGRKVVSAVILENLANATYHVIALATGNRCITGDKVSLNGQVVNDSHAEVVVRRALVFFLYKQLYLHVDSQRPPHPSSTISSQKFELFEETIRTDQLRGFRVKPTWKFHLYVSTAPCGDSALFSNKENMMDRNKVQYISKTQHQPIFEHSTQGQLRSKIEGGEGTIPVPVTKEPYQRQSLDGILRGERLKTMSCSDKLARWNYLGLQGALLSQFLEPVFIETVILGNLFNAGHLSRAICCRLCGNNNSNPNSGSKRSLSQSSDGCSEKINHPNLAASYIGESTREIDKTNELSINWCFGEKIEVIDGVTGYLSDKLKAQSEYSRLCKASLFREYRRLSSVVRPSFNISSMTYCESKSVSEAYQTRRSTFFKNISSSRLGSWICKPLELTGFNNISL